MSDADKLQKYETIMRRAAAVCGSEENWERIDELVALLHSQYTHERESANQYAQMYHAKIKEYMHWEPEAYVEVDEKMENNNIIHELEVLVNKYSFDAKTNTPDYILADYLVNCLEIYRKTNEQREKWHGRGRQVSVDATDTWEDTRARCS